MVSSREIRVYTYLHLHSLCRIRSFLFNFVLAHCGKCVGVHVRTALYHWPCSHFMLMAQIPVSPSLRCLSQSQ